MNKQKNNWLVYFIDNINHFGKMKVMLEQIKFSRKIKEVYIKNLRKSWNQILLKLPHNLFFINQIEFLEKGGFR